MTIPIDLTGLIRAGLEADRREPDGLLHASSDIVGSLRHSQLRFVGAPELESNFVSDVRLMTGTLWHNYVHKLLKESGMPFMEEVNLTPWMPEGWSGTADWLFFHPEYEAFVLGDLKTTKGESIKFRREEGMSVDHYHQLSAYWHALVNAGFPMLDEFFLMYLPMNTSLKEPDIEPVVCQATPIPEDVLLPMMGERLAACVEYEQALYEGPHVAESYDIPQLAPPQERVQKLFWKGTDSKWEVKLVPHWSTDFCPFPNELCDCSEQGETKIGEYRIVEASYEGDELERVEYWPRKGYSEINPEVGPDDREIKRRLRSRR